MWFSITLVAAALGSLTALLLSVYIFFQGARDKLRLTYSLAALAAGLWLCFYTFWLLEDNYDQALLYIKVAMSFAILTYPTLLHFVVEFIQLKRKKLIVWLSYLSALCIIALNWTTHLFIDSLTEKLFYKHWPVSGGLVFDFYTTIWGVVILFSLVQVYLFYKQARNTVEKAQAKIVLIALTLGYIGGASNFFLWYNVPIPPVGNILIPIYFGLIAYAILRYRFMDIRLVIKRSTVFTLLVIILTAIYSFLVIFFSQQLEALFGRQSQLVVSIIVSILIVAGFQPLKTFIQKTTNRFLFTDDYDPQQVLANLSEILSSSLDLQRLFNGVGEIIDTTLFPNRSAVLLYDEDTDGYTVADADNVTEAQRKQLMSLTVSGFVAPYLQKTRTIVVNQELQRQLDAGVIRGDVTDAQRLVAWMQAAGVELLIPLLSKNELIAISLLGPKKSGDPYSAEDLRLLEIGSAQAAVAIENALIYEELKQFNATLTQEVQKATEDLRAANKRLKKLDAAKSEFISIASHQLRTPLTVIKGYISMMLEGSFGQLNDKEVESLHMVYESNQRLINLVEDLLNISRIESGRLQFNWQEQQVETLVDSVVGELQQNARRKKLYLDFKAPTRRLPKVRMDEQKLRQVFMNLVDNAVKYTDAGGITVTVKQEANKAVIRVTDTGIGIDAADLPNLFQKFSRGEGMSLVHTEGTGLGLYVAREMVLAHGGQISADSAGTGKGSTFVVTLPFAADFPEPPSTMPKKKMIGRDE